MGTVVLVTGANGFVGRHIVNRLASNREYRVIATDIHDNAIPLYRDGPAPAAYYTGDLRDAGFLETLFQQEHCDRIVHLAGVLSKAEDARTHRLCFETNVYSTLNVLQRAREQRSRVIFPSTGLIYGNREGPFTENMTVAPADFYSLSKKMAEELIVHFHKRFDLSYLIFRPAILYGPAQHGTMFIPSALATLRAGKEFDMTAGEQKRDFLFVEDFTDAVIAACENDRACGIYNAGSGTSITLREAANSIETVLDIHGMINAGARDYREHEVWEYELDSSRAEKELGWRANTDFESGIRAIIEYDNNKEGERA
jgi:UDP-glucose 4-epimerase